MGSISKFILEIKMLTAMETIVATGYSKLAEELYYFVKSRGKLPDGNTVLRILNSGTSMSDIGNKLNYLFLEATKEALLSAVFDENREKIAKLLTLTINIQEDSRKDSFQIGFMETTISHVDSVRLVELYYAINRYEKDFLIADLDPQVSFSLEASQQLIEKLLAIDGLDSYLLQTTAKPSDKREFATYILQTGLIYKLYRQRKNAYLIRQVKAVFNKYYRKNHWRLAHFSKANFYVINVKV